MLSAFSFSNRVDAFAQGLVILGDRMCHRNDVTNYLARALGVRASVHQAPKDTSRSAKNLRSMAGVSG